jgi:hypothetical protein
MSNKFVIGISGFARSGKDTLAGRLSERLSGQGLSVKILSFAHALKSDIDSFCKTKIGISAFTEETELKSKIRPILIAYGASQRQISGGRYWLDKLKPEVDDFFSASGNVVIIPDLRFKEYDFDEYDFVKSYRDNLILTVSKTLENGDQNPPAHESESKNFPFFLEKSDYNLFWNSSKDEEYLSKKTTECLNIFNSKLNQQ